MTVALGLDEADTNRQNLDVYREAFEKPFLNATERYYKAESEQFIGDNSVTEYMKKAETRLGEEETRVDMYLHASTRKGVRFRSSGRIALRKLTRILCDSWCTNARKYSSRIILDSCKKNSNECVFILHA